MKSENSKGITLMNAFLCLCVVMIHLTSEPLMQLNYGSVQHIIMFTVNKLLCFSVPGFIFLSGFKLYTGYGNKKIDLKRFYGGRVKKILVPYLISVLVYFVYFYLKKWVNFTQLPQYIFLGTLAAHFYYVIIAVQFYILFPFIKNIFIRYDMIITVTALICMICSRELLHFNYTDRFIGTYIFYFILGMFFAKNRDNVLKKSYCAINIAGFIITSVIYLIYLYKASVGEVSYRFENILNIIYVSFSIMALYTVYSSLSEKCSILYNISKYLSAVSYNIYLYHIFVMSILKYDIMTRFNLSARVEFLVTFIVLYFIIFIYLAVDSRIRNRLNS